MQIHNTVLALQIMNGVKVYAVRFLNDTRVKQRSEAVIDDGAGYFDDPTLTYSTKRYHYKSADDLRPGTHVIVPTNKGARFAIAKIDREVEAVDFDDDVRLLWINQVIEDPAALFKSHAQHDNDARRKLAASQAKKAAQEHLDMLGLDASAFAIEAPKDGDKNDA